MRDGWIFPNIVFTMSQYQHKILLIEIMCKIYKLYKNPTNLYNIYNKMTIISSKSKQSFQ